MGQQIDLVDYAIDRMRLPPYPHQVTALRAITERDHYGLFLEMRTGKSKIVIDAACLTHHQKSIDALVVVAPKGVYRTWLLDQLPTHLWEDTPHKVEAWKSGAGAGQHKEYMKLLTFKGLAVFVVNIEAIATAKCAEYLFHLMMNRRCMLVIDESSCIKNPSAARTKQAMKLARLSAYRLILSGTPVTQGPLDLYSQLEFLHPGLSGSRSYFAFRAKYAIQTAMRMGPRSFNKVVGFRNLHQLQVLLDAVSMSVKLADVRADLPPKIYQVIQVELSPEHRKVYEDFRKNAVMKLGEQVVVSATMALSVLAKLHQIVCGFALRDDGTVLDLSDARLETLMEILEQVQGKAVIFALHQLSVEQIASALRLAYGAHSVVSYYGPTSEADRDLARDKFQRDPTCRFFVGTAATAGEGLDLAAANVVVYYSNSYSLKQRLQSEARPFGPAQKDPVLIIDIVSPGTVDEKVVEALKNKADIASLLQSRGWRELLDN